MLSIFFCYFFIVEISSNSCTESPVNDLKSSGFLDNLNTKATKEQIDEQLKIIKLFSINYARDLYKKLWHMLIKTL
jgi:hypothetical protein